MPTTRKKILKTVYRDENDSETEKANDFSDSGSDAQISEQSTSDNEESAVSSEDNFKETSNRKRKITKPKRKIKFAKTFINTINKQPPTSGVIHNHVTANLFSVKDLNDSDKLLPTILNLSESDSSDDELPKKISETNIHTCIDKNQESNSDTETRVEYKDVWSNYIQNDSEEIAKKSFLELEKHKSKIDETKTCIHNYSAKIEKKRESNVSDLLAQGEEVIAEQIPGKELKTKNIQNNSDSDIDDWEEVKETKTIPQQGLQLIVDFPDAVCRKTKKIDVEMMMKRKINRVKKEYQVYMHKVHVLCWIAHGNYISRVLNDQDVLTAALSLVPSKECYPNERVDMKYVEQITNWYKDKLTLKQDKNENKFKPKAPPFKNILLQQIKSRIVTTKKYMVFIFVSMLRALGLQCRVVFNFITLPIKPPSSELCSLSTKSKEEKKDSNKKTEGSSSNKDNKKAKKTTSKQRISQMDGNDDSYFCSDSNYENIMQVDGNNDILTIKPRSVRSTRTRNDSANKSTCENKEDVSPPKRSKKNSNVKSDKIKKQDEDVRSPSQKRKRTVINKVYESSPCTNNKVEIVNRTPLSLNRRRKIPNNDNNQINKKMDTEINNETCLDPSSSNNDTKMSTKRNKISESNDTNTPVADVKTRENVSSTYFQNETSHIQESNGLKTKKLPRRQDNLIKPSTSKSSPAETKPRAKNTSKSNMERSKYFSDTNDNKISDSKRNKRNSKQVKIKNDTLGDNQRVSHRDLLAETKTKPKGNVTNDLVNIIKNRIKEAKAESRKGLVKGKLKEELDEDSDYLPEETLKRSDSRSDDDFKSKKISPKPSTSRKIDRRVLSSDEETPKINIDVWCEVFVEELEQWICVDVIKAKVHCTNKVYSQATHPVCYTIGWDNNNYLKDLTRRYVPHWNTVTRKQRVDNLWWEKAVQPWLGPKTARDREEDEYLDRIQSEAPLPKSITEYKNHPLYALKRHLLKFQAIYPPDAATLGFIRNEPVYARDCVYTCRSRDTWLKEAKVVRLGEQPYKIVKARPKWDKLSNKLITDKPLDLFGQWQVQDYEPPVAENGIVPRNPYGNVELFKDCMLPKGTVHIKLPGLNKVARKLNIDCAPAMTGFDFNGGWSHPVFDGFVVCKEFEEIITEAWIKDQEEQERKEREKIETRVYGNWKRLIKGLLIRERLKNKYGFENPATSQPNKKISRGPRLVVNKKN